MISSKKSQLELLGLAIVIVLILIAIIFIAKFFLLKPPSQIRKDFVKSELAESMVQAMLDTNIEGAGCDYLDYGDLIIDCAGQDGNICNSQPSCGRLKDSLLENLFANTLEHWNVNYQLIVATNGADISDKNHRKVDKTNILGGPACLDNLQVQRKGTEFILPTRTTGKEAQILLLLC